MIIAILSLGFSVYKIVDCFRQAYEISESTEQLYSKAFENNNGNDAGYSFDCEEVQSENPDIIAWIYSENTPINYPILQGYDNSKYLRQAVDGSYNIAGSIFLDYRNKQDFSDFISIVYGHNMKNDSMFGTLPEYISQNYYENHKTIDIYTKERLLVADVVSGFVCDNDFVIYEMTTYNNDRKAFIDMIKEHSDFTPDAEFGVEDFYVVLSTCSYEYDNARYVLIGKLNR